MSRFHILCAASPQDTYVRTTWVETKEPDEALQQRRAALWEARAERARRAGQVLFNGPLVGLSRVGVEVTARGECIIQLSVFPTDYRSYVAFREDRALPAPDPIGTCVLPVTRDGCLVVSRRSLQAEVNPGRLFSVGGFVDPTIDTHDGSPCLMRCARRELEEELSLAPSLVADLRFLGIAYDLLNPHPEAAFLARVNLSSEELSRNTADPRELTKLEAWPIGALEREVEASRAEITEGMLGALSVLLPRFLKADRDAV